jgi:hypothetical protein
MPVQRQGPIAPLENRFWMHVAIVWAMIARYRKLAYDLPARKPNEFTRGMNGVSARIKYGTDA